MVSLSATGTISSMDFPARVHLIRSPCFVLHQLYLQCMFRALCHQMALEDLFLLMPAFSLSLWVMVLVLFMFRLSSLLLTDMEVLFRPQVIKYLDIVVELERTFLIRFRAATCSPYLEWSKITRKKGMSILFLTKEIMEERRLLKHLCKNYRCNLQDNPHCRRFKGEAASALSG